MISLIHKKGNIEKVENYKGIILLCLAYKIYAGILAEKLKNEMEEKEALQETQAGFRKGRVTMDNVYVVQHVVKQKLKEKGGKVFIFFMDLKAAFDRVNRKVL